MKLKKIASLALAGVMAVSMLAACGDKTGTTENDGTQVEVTTSAIVTAMNNGQDPDNDVKVAFTDGDDLATALQKSVSVQGVVEVIKAINGSFSTMQTNILKQVAFLTGKGGTITNATSGATTGDLNTFTGADDDEDVTVLYLNAYKASDYFNTESYVLRQAAEDMNKEIAGLETDSGTPYDPDDPVYYTYSYTGETTMVTISRLNNETYYLVLTAITRTPTEAEYNV